MSVRMAKPVTPFPLPPEKEQAVLNDIQLSDKPLYIRSKESEVHVGTKIVFEIRNKEDIKTLHPLIELLGQSSSDLSCKNSITEVRERQSHSDKPSVVTDSNNSGKNYITDSPMSQNTVGIHGAKRSESTLAADAETPLEDRTMALPNNQEESFLLTPDYFQKDKMFESINGDNLSSRHTTKAETITQHNASVNSCQSHPGEKPLKLAMPQQPLQCSEHYSYLPSTPYQHTGITSQSHHPLTSCHEENSCNTKTIESTHLQRLSSQHSHSLPFGFASPPLQVIEKLPRVMMRDDIPIKCPNDERPSDYQIPLNKNYMSQPSHSLPLGFASPPPQVLENFPRVRMRDEIPVKSAKDERPSDYQIPLNKNYMEERKYKLYIVPGVFYDTPHGILVEIRNGSNYEIGLANDNSEDCDVNLYVDMELVYRLRLDAYSRTIVPGPQNSKWNFVFLRAIDAPPEANIMKGHERNGQIKAVFIPSTEKRRAWSADSAASCSQFLNQALGNIMGHSPKGSKASPPPAPEQQYRSASFCSGATALQGKQREKFHELAEYMSVDENRMVILQLRLVASIGDQSRPSTAEPIVPLITKMPPPLPF